MTLLVNWCTIKNSWKKLFEYQNKEFVLVELIHKHFEVLKDYDK